MNSKIRCAAALALALTACNNDPSSHEPEVDGGPPPAEPKVRISPTSGLVTSETGTGASFTVELTARPDAEVRILMHSTDESEGTLETSEVVFTPADFSPRTVHVLPVNDDDSDGNQLYSIKLDPTFSDDLRFQGLATGEVFLTSIDDETPSITVSTTSSTSIAEAAGEVTFEVRLGSRPTGQVTVPLASAAPARARLSVDQLVFVPLHWNEPQKFTVTAVDDAIDFDGETIAIRALPAQSSDVDYLGLDASDVEVQLADDDQASVKVTPFARTAISEYDHESFTVVLTSQPSAPVLIPVGMSPSGQANLNTSSLTFTAANWDVPQVVRVTGIDDNRVDGDTDLTVSLGPVGSLDASYAGTVLPAQTLKLIDQDVAHLYASLRNSSFNVTQESTFSSFDCLTIDVGLATLPTSTVTLRYTVSDPTEGRPSTGGTVFGTFDHTFQSFTVCGVDDFIDDGDQSYTVTVSATSSDPLYNGLSSVINLVNRDDDSSSVRGSGENIYQTTEAGGTMLLHVRLASQPSAPVTVVVSSGDETEGTVPATPLTFTPDTWNVNQDLIVTGQDDSERDGNVFYDLYASTTSDDSLYNARTFDLLTMRNLDND